MNPYSVVFTPRAKHQLDELYVYIASESGEVRAGKFVGEIIDDCLSLSTFPERGTKREDIRPNLRVKSYARKVVIAFSADTIHAVVAIYGIFYGGQDWEQLLSWGEER